ncbi:MAG: hypothetical protein HY898_17745 [Deltaproteobacteria bacterium]|nr:hypothetical protein [Deltaproteobacteria bacterium]
MPRAPCCLIWRAFVSASALALLAAASLPGCDSKRSAPPDRVGPPEAGANPPGARAGAGSDVSGLAKFLPPEVGENRPSGEDGHYDRRTIFDLLDGGAEVLLALNLKAAVSRHYVRPGAPELSVDLFDLGSSNDAFGAYHHDMREGASAGFGRESELAGSSVFFWKDRYYVSVVAYANTPEARDAVKAVGKAVADRIQTPGEIPRIVASLPSKGLVPSQVHYFHTWQLLRSHYPFPTDDLLGLGNDTEGVLAHYGQADAGGEGARTALFIVRYPSGARAQQGRQRFASGWLPGVDAGIGRTERGWAGVKVSDELVVGVIDASSAEQVGELFAAVDRTRDGGK